jgi:hypothetical protein
LRFRLLNLVLAPLRLLQLLLLPVLALPELLLAAAQLLRLPRLLLLDQSPAALLGLLFFRRGRAPARRSPLGALGQLRLLPRFLLLLILQPPLHLQFLPLLQLLLGLGELVLCLLPLPRCSTCSCPLVTTPCCLVRYHAVTIAAEEGCGTEERWRLWEGVQAVERVRRPTILAAAG